MNRNNRRGFLKTGTIATAGLALSRQVQASGKLETLAVAGGSKAVTHPHEGSTTWPLFADEEKQALIDLINKPGYGDLDRFEQEWGAYFGTPHCKAHCNCTSALMSGYFALDLAPGSEVLVPSLNLWFGIVPMRFFGLVPVFVDSRPSTMNFDLEDAKRRLTKRTKAILVVHLHGVPCEMDTICEFAKEKGLLVLEDCAHAHNATLKNKFVGNWGDIGAFSFQSSKVLAAMEGGMANYQSKSLAERATALGHYSKCQGDYASYRETGLGMKLRMNPMAAAVARCQLKKLPEQTKLERDQQRRLCDRLTQLPGLTEQAVREDMTRVYWGANQLFLDEKKAEMSRHSCVQALRAEGVSISDYNFTTATHKHRIFREPKWWHHQPTLPDHLPGVERAMKTRINLPRFTTAVPDLIDQYIAAFEKVWSHRSALR